MEAVLKIAKMYIMYIEYHYYYYSAKIYFPNKNEKVYSI